MREEDKEVFINRLRCIIATLRKDKCEGPKQSLGDFEAGYNSGINGAIGEIQDVIDEIPRWT